MRDDVRESVPKNGAVGPRYKTTVLLNKYCYTFLLIFYNLEKESKVFDLMAYSRGLFNASLLVNNAIDYNS